MTDHAAPTPTAAPAPDKPTVQEYPKWLYRDAPAHEAEASPDTIIVGDKTAEDLERKQGYLDVAEYDKSKHEKKATAKK